MELQIPTSKVAHLKSVSVRPASLDAPVGEEGDSATFGEIVGDENAASPYDQLRDKNLNLDLRSMIDSLEKREAEIIRLRFGLDGRSYRSRFDNPQKSFLDGVVDTQSSECDALGSPLSSEPRQQQ